MVETVTAAQPETETSGPTLEEQAEKLGLLAGDEQPQEEPEVKEERPGWLPEKFRSAEEMAKAYSALEQKQSKQAAETTTDEAREAVESAGVDFDALSTEYAENGELSEKAYEDLDKAGIPRRIVNSYIDAQLGQAEVAQQKAYDSVGGQENYQNMVGWASNNLSDSEIDAFNEAVNSGNPSSVELAINGLKARYESTEGVEPARTIAGNVARNSGGVYRSLAELMTDMQSSEYKNDPAFRSDVERKLANSDVLESRRG